MFRYSRRVTAPVGAALLLTLMLALALTSTGAARSLAGPVLVEEPSITGVALVGRALEADPGYWSGVQPITYQYQWLRCKADAGDDSSTASCTVISGATDDDYVVSTADAGSRLRVRVWANNKQGKTQATSAATSVVSTEDGKPASSAAPTISGSAVVGSTLTGSKGAWVGDSPITYQYQWLRCDKDGNACKTIGGKTQTSYKVVQGDVGKTLRFGVRAKNSRGSADAFSVQTGVVQDAGGDGGVITLPDGSKSIDVKDVPKGERLIVDKVVFSPSLVTSATDPIVTHIRVEDTRGYVVRNAIVFVRSTPKVTSGGDNSPTATDGWVTYVLYPENDIVIKTGYSIQFYVKAYRKGDPSLAGVSGTRLVQVATQS